MRTERKRDASVQGAAALLKKPAVPVVGQRDRESDPVRFAVRAGATIDDAVKSGTVRAIDDAHDRGTLPGWAATVLKTVVKHAPISWFLDNVPFDKIPFLH